MKLYETLLSALGLAPQSPRLVDLSHLPELAGDLNRDVVGESFYTDSFKQLRKTLRAKPGDEREVVVELRLAPENKMSSSGKAVAVFINGLHVGHLPEGDCVTYFDKISERGSSARAKGRVWFDYLVRQPSRTSVQFLSFYPPKFTDEDPPLGYQTSHSFYLKFSESKQQRVDALYQKRIAEGAGQLPELKADSGIFLSSIEFPDNRILEDIMTANKFEVRPIRTKVRGADLMIVSEKAGIAESVHTSNALDYGIPIVTLEEFFDAYPQFDPGPYFREKRRQFFEWNRALHKEFGFRVKDEQLIGMFSRGRLVAPGNSFYGQPEFSSSYPKQEDPELANEFFELRRDTMRSAGAELYDSLFVLAELGSKKRDGRLPIMFEGRELAMTPISYTGNFQMHIDDRLNRDVILQLSWLSEGQITAEFDMRFEHPIMLELFGISKD